ncbi:MAG: SDH family Clp fold serine proteinase [Candidatus Electrothrix sp. YB6]
MPEKEEVEQEEEKLDLDDFSEVINLVQNHKENEEFIKNTVLGHIDSLIRSSGLEKKYNIIFLYDDNRSISHNHSDAIYRALSSVEKQIDVLLIIHSRGGSIEPAYLISKSCKRLAKKKFSVAIPRRAKSAATLISLGADEIHMGLMSEIGPIDPQINKLPAVAMSNALRKIAELSSEYPKSSEMFSRFLKDNLSLSVLGYFERVNESAAQYASRLLSNKKLPSGSTPESLGDHFTNHYKDHSFVIDVDESEQLLGKTIVKKDTDEYNLANSIYQFMNLFEMVCWYYLEKEVSIVGKGDHSINFVLKEK